MKQPVQLKQPNHLMDLGMVHLSIFFFGLSGMFSKYITVAALTQSMMRGVFSSLFLLLLLLITKESFRLSSRRDAAVILIAGVILAGHWVTYMYSIQISTVAIGTLTVAAGPLFLTFAEPLLYGEKIRPSAFVSALIMTGGILLLVPSFDFGNAATQGIIWGVISALLYGVFTLMNRDLTTRYSGVKIAFLEHSTLTLVLLPSIFFTGASFTSREFGLLALSGIVVTAIPHILYITGQKTVSAQTCGVIRGLESIYGIIAAAVILSEIPTPKTILGGAVILFAAVFSSLLSAKGKPEKPGENPRGSSPLPAVCCETIPSLEKRKDLISS